MGWRKRLGFCRVPLRLHIPSESVMEIDMSLRTAKLEKGTPNLGVLAEYKNKLDAYLSRAKDLEEITAERDAAKATYDELRTKRLAEFMEGFTAISQKLKEMYQVGCDGVGCRDLGH